MTIFRYEERVLKVLVLGAYGLIGSEITRALLARGDEVVGLARSKSVGERRFPKAKWIGADLARLCEAGNWADKLVGIDAVVNASGALQSGGGDDLSAAQNGAIAALIKACESTDVQRFVQVSAPGAEIDADTEFLRTKASADAALRQSTLDWVIFKPGLVISANAYGGTSLLRLLAAVPVVQPLVLADARIQTVGVEEVADAVLRGLDDKALIRREFALVAPQQETLQSTVRAFRKWLGFREPVFQVIFPACLGFTIAKFADLAGLLGWRSPLRSTALKVMRAGIVGDPEPWLAVSQQRLRGLSETLERLPSSAQERLFARSAFIFPVAVMVFAIFWIASGLIGFWQVERAQALVSGRLGAPLATALVFVGSVLDITIGLGMLFRKTFRLSCIAGAMLCFGYLIFGTLLSPDLWRDPLGPLLKIIPALLLSLVLAGMQEER